MVPSSSTSSTTSAAILSGPTVILSIRPLLFSLWELTKPRLALFSVLSAMTGFLLAGGISSGLSASFISSVIGISMAAGGALSFNQCLERTLDARMTRTRSRPLPAGKISPELAMGWSAFLSLGGTFLLTLGTNPLAGALAAATIFIYGCLYTPLKRLTPWATEVGAFSGALPPLIGAAAAGAIQTPAAWVFAAFVLVWQMPHFFAIGWLHRMDYASAGFRLRPAIDSTGENTARWICIYSVVLLVVSILPSLMGWISWAFAVAATPPAILMVVSSIRFARRPVERDEHARKLFFLTLIHLPAVMLALAAAA